MLHQEIMQQDKQMNEIIRSSACLAAALSLPPVIVIVPLTSMYASL